MTNLWLLCKTPFPAGLPGRDAAAALSVLLGHLHHRLLQLLRVHPRLRRRRGQRHGHHGLHPHRARDAIQSHTKKMKFVHACGTCNRILILLSQFLLRMLRCHVIELPSNQTRLPAGACSTRRPRPRTPTGPPPPPPRMRTASTRRRPTSTRRRPSSRKSSPCRRPPSHPCPKCVIKR